MKKTANYHFQKQIESSGGNQSVSQSRSPVHRNLDFIWLQSLYGNFLQMISIDSNERKLASRNRLLHSER